MIPLLIVALVVAAVVAASLWTARRDDAGPQPFRPDYDSRLPHP